jgi:Fe-S cluster biogenesis protein NfuA
VNDVENYEAIEALFDETIRPILVGDGGNIELDLVKGNEVVVSFVGACGSCPSSAGGTLRGIEQAIRRSGILPEAIVIPTNAYQPPAIGGVHPFGGKTYEEQMRERQG